MLEEHCHICRQEGPLSFEHLPPRSALNKEKAVLFGMMDWLNRDSPKKGKGKQFQGGVGVKTLCNSCNNNTGAWYVPELSKLVHTGARMLTEIPPETLQSLNNSSGQKMYTDCLFKGVRPLPIIKQIATMFMAHNTLAFRDTHPDLADFILNKEATGLPEGYQFHLMFYVGPFTRYSSMGVSLDTKTGVKQCISEIAAPPFCYVLTVENEVCLPYGSINHFADFGYKEETELPIRTPVLLGNTPYALDYRTKSELEEQLKQSEAAIPTL